MLSKHLSIYAELFKEEIAEAKQKAFEAETAKWKDRLEFAENLPPGNKKDKRIRVCEEYLKLQMWKALGLKQ